jgi:hypothetical protein
VRTRERGPPSASAEILLLFLLTMVDYSTLNYLDGFNVPRVFDTQISLMGKEFGYKSFNSKMMN